jgi:GxxExxY protein
MELIYKDEAYAIIGACFEVYNEVGYGFGEPIYQECLTLELALREIPFRDQDEIKLTYKGKPLKQNFKPDFICTTRSSWKSRPYRSSAGSTAPRCSTI